MRTEPMENNHGLTGFAVTSICFISSKILLFIKLFTLAQAASTATLLSGVTVFLINLPKLLKLYGAYVRPIFKKGGRK